MGVHSILGYFNPRSPCGERLSFSGNSLYTCPISTHAPRAGSDLAWLQRWTVLQGISTHAPRAGSDDYNTGGTGGNMISTHAPRAGSDWTALTPLILKYNFNPRSPCGERRDGLPHKVRHLVDFNPRSPCGERLSPQTIVIVAKVFQPTLPVRGATFRRCNQQRGDGFQPTLPVRGAT